MKKSFLVPQEAILKVTEDSGSDSDESGYASGKSRSSSPNRGDDVNKTKLKEYLQYRESCWDGTVKEYDDVEWEIILSRNTPMLTDFNVEKAKEEAGEMWKFVNGAEMRESLKKIIAEEFNLKYEVTEESFLDLLHKLITDADDMIRAILHGGGPSFVKMREQINSHRDRNLFNLDLEDSEKAWKKLNFDSFAGQAFINAQIDIEDFRNFHQLGHVFSIPQTIVDAVTIECDGKVTEDQCKSYIQEYLPSTATSDDNTSAYALSRLLSTHDYHKLFGEMDQMDKEQNANRKWGAKKMLTVMLKEYLKRFSGGIRDLVNKITQNEPLGEYEYQGKKTKEFRFYLEQIKLIKENAISFSSLPGSQIHTIINIGELLVEMIPDAADVAPAIIPDAADVAPELQTQSSTRSLFSKVVSKLYIKNYIEGISAKLSNSELTTSAMSDITKEAIRAF